LKLFNLAGLLDLFSEADRPRITQALEKVPNVAVYRDPANARISLHALTPEPATVLDDGAELIGTFIRPVNDSKTQQALRLMQSSGCSAYAAAKQIGIHPSVITRAKKRNSKPHCPCCGQALQVKA
jgi:hypothetical protein